LNSIASAEIELAGVTIFPETEFTFTTEGYEGRKWRYHDNSGPVKRFNIDWKGTRFNYKKAHFPISFQSEVITSSETVLTMAYNKRKLHGPVTININGQATVNIDSHGDVTATVPVDVERPHKEVTLTLPFPLLDSSEITITGCVSKTIDVGDHLRASVGRYRIQMDFDEDLFPSGAWSTPRELTLSVAVGDEAYAGSDTITHHRWCVFFNRWIHGRGN
jgi:hypothetical protein